MRSVYEQRVAEATEINGQIRQGKKVPVKIVTRKFGAVAKVIWPFKTAAHIAAIANTNERTAARWLSGEFDPPLVVVLATMDEIFLNGEAQRPTDR